MTRKPKDFVERSIVRGCLALVCDWSAICALCVYSCWADSLLVYLGSVWVIGSRQFAIGEALIHEATHYNLFKKKAWNDRLNIVYGLPFGVSIARYRAEHVVHHAKLGQKDDHLVEDYEALGLRRPGRNMAWIWFVRPILGYPGWHYARRLTLSPWRDGLRIVTLWCIMIALFVYLDNLHILVFYWFVPLFWSYPAFLYWSEIGDHFRTVSGTRSNVGFLWNLLHHNTGFHAIHHNYPTIPWYRLREAHAALFTTQDDVSCGFLGTYRQISDVQRYATEVDQLQRPRV